MRTITQAQQTQINRPTVEVVQYEGQDTYTYQVSFPNATYTRKAEYDKKAAKERADAFNDAFNNIAADIENGGRKRFIMRELGLTNDDNSLWYAEVRKRQDDAVLQDRI